LLVLAVVLGTCSCREARRDPQTGRVRVLYIGDAWGPSPFFHMQAEPLLSATPIPATYEHLGTYSYTELNEFMRIYMPRTYRQFTDNYDVLILSDTNRNLYKIDQLQWFRRGVFEEGIGMMMVGGVEAFGAEAHPTWGDSPVEEALPVDCIDDETFRFDFKVTVEIPGHPFIESLPWETMPIFRGMNVVDPKPGSDVLLRADLRPFHPVLVYWEYGEGASLAHTPDWTPGWGSMVMNYWDYYPDYVVNLQYLVAGIEIPDDPDLIHEIRERFVQYRIDRALAISLMDFVEEFGADISVGQEHFDEISDLHSEAEELYIEQEYVECLELTNRLDEEFAELSEELVDLKESALFWIYVVEWVAVTATGLVCGFVVWTLMVKRRLYREVQITRASM